MHDPQPTDRSVSLLRSLADGLAAAPNCDFFCRLAHTLATTLGLRYCFLAECLDTPASRVRTLAFWDGARMVDNFEYDLAGTPCRRVMGGVECRFDRGVRGLFPDDLDLVKLEAESYAALPLRNTWGQVIGHLAVLDTQPFQEAGPDFALLRLCADRAAAELERLRLNERLGRAQRLETVGRLTSGLLHELNNVLTAIAGYAELLGHQLTEGDERQADCGEILTAAHRGHRLLRQLAVFQKRQSGPPRCLDLNHLVDELAPRLRQLLGDEAELSTVLSAERAEVVVDPVIVEQVLLGLLAPPRHVSVLTQPRHQRITTRLVELGATAPELATGMPSGTYVALGIDDGESKTAARERAGARAAAASGEAPLASFAPDPELGEQLGWPTLYGSAREAGANLLAEPRTEGGYRFTLLLPLADRPADTGAEASPRETGQTLLVVDDRPEVRRLLGRMLERGGYRVLCAGDAREALELGQGFTGQISLLITDILLPDFDGWELGRRWRDRRPGAPILYISGSIDEALLSSSHIAGGSSFLRKPFSSQKLLEKISQMLAASAGS